MSRLGSGLAVAMAMATLPADPSAVGAQALTEITVANTSDEVNGDVSSVASLQADPGPDGVSLREAIEATNNDQGPHTIRFDPALTAATIGIAGGLPELTGGGVTVDGDIDGDGDPDVTIAPSGGGHLAWGVSIASSGNQIHAVALRGFETGVQLQPSVSGLGLPTDQTYANNRITNTLIVDVSEGIAIRSGFSPACPGPPEPQQCETHNTWTNTTIVGNTIEALPIPGVDGPRGIRAFMAHVGDSFEHATVTDNSIRIVGEDTDSGIALEGAGESTDARISDVAIARNSIEGSVGIGIALGAGSNRAQRATLEDVQVIDNHLRLVGDGSWFCCQGIVVGAGADSPEFAVGPPVRYLDDNLVRNISVQGNTITGTLQWGVQVTAGFGGGGRRNQVQNVRIKKNMVRTSLPTLGMWVITGDGHPFKKRYASDNSISSLLIKGNRFRIGRGPGHDHAGGGVGAGGVVLVGGHSFGRDNRIRSARIANNRIKTAYVGIKVIGGLGRTARGNQVTCVRLARNRVAGTRTAVSVVSNVGRASRNRASLGC